MQRKRRGNTPMRPVPLLPRLQQSQLLQGFPLGAIQHNQGSSQIPGLLSNQLTYEPQINHLYQVSPTVNRHILRIPQVVRPHVSDLPISHVLNPGMSNLQMSQVLGQYIPVTQLNQQAINFSQGRFQEAFGLQPNSYVNFQGLNNSQMINSQVSECQSSPVINKQIVSIPEQEVQNFHLESKGLQDPPILVPISKVADEKLSQSHGLESEMNRHTSQIPNVTRQNINDSQPRNELPSQVKKSSSKLDSDNCHTFQTPNLNQQHIKTSQPRNEVQFQFKEPSFNKQHSQSQPTLQHIKIPQPKNQLQLQIKKYLLNKQDRGLLHNSNMCLLPKSDQNSPVSERPQNVQQFPSTSSTQESSCTVQEHEFQNRSIELLQIQPFPSTSSTQESSCTVQEHEFQNRSIEQLQNKPLLLNTSNTSQRSQNKVLGNIKDDHDVRTSNLSKSDVSAPGELERERLGDVNNSQLSHSQRDLVNEAGKGQINESIEIDKFNSSEHITSKEKMAECTIVSSDQLGENSFRAPVSEHVQRLKQIRIKKKKSCSENNVPTHNSRDMEFTEMQVHTNTKGDVNEKRSKISKDVQSEKVIKEMKQIASSKKRRDRNKTTGHEILDDQHGEKLDVIKIVRVQETDNSTVKQGSACFQTTLSKNKVKTRYEIKKNRKLTLRLEHDNLLHQHSGSLISPVESTDSDELVIDTQQPELSDEEIVSDYLEKKQFIKNDKETSQSDRYEGKQSHDLATSNETECEHKMSTFQCPELVQLERKFQVDEHVVPIYENNEESFENSEEDWPPPKYPSGLELYELFKSCHQLEPRSDLADLLPSSELDEPHMTNINPFYSPHHIVPPILICPLTIFPFSSCSWIGFNRERPCHVTTVHRNLLVRGSVAEIGVTSVAILYSFNEWFVCYTNLQENVLYCVVQHACYSQPCPSAFEYVCEIRRGCEDWSMMQQCEVATMFQTFNYLRSKERCVVYYNADEIRTHREDTNVKFQIIPPRDLYMKLSWR